MFTFLRDVPKGQTQVTAKWTPPHFLMHHSKSALDAELLELLNEVADCVEPGPQHVVELKHAGSVAGEAETPDPVVPQHFLPREPEAVGHRFHASKHRLDSGVT